MVEAIALDHNPTKVKNNPALTSLVHVSDAVTLQMGMGLGIDGLQYPLSSDALQLIGVENSDLESLMVEIVDLFIDKDVLN